MNNPHGRCVSTRTKCTAQSTLKGKMGIHPQLEVPTMKDVNIQLSLCQKLYARNIKLLATPPLVAVRESIAKTVERADLKAFPGLRFCGRTSERNLENGENIQCSLQRLDFHSDSFFLRISIHPLAFLQKALIFVLQTANL